MGYRRYKPVKININGKEIEMINSHGCYSAEYVRNSGKPYKAEDRKENWYSKTQCLKMKKPVLEGEEPIAFSRAMHGYYPLYQRDYMKVGRDS